MTTPASDDRRATRPGTGGATATPATWPRTAHAARNPTFADGIQPIGGTGRSPAASERRKGRATRLATPDGPSEPTASRRDEREDRGHERHGHGGGETSGPRPRTTAVGLPNLSGSRSRTNDGGRRTR